MVKNAGHHSHHPDYILLATLVALVIFGLAMLASASSNIAEIKFNDAYYYLKHQVLFGLTLGLIGFSVGYFLRYQYLKKIAFILLLMSIATLILVFTPLGSQVRNTNRWLIIGPLSFQPAEFMKLAFIVYLAAWLSNPKFKRATDFHAGLLPFLIISGIIAGLLLLQPATSTVAILLLSALTVYFMSGAPVKYIFLIALGGVLLFGLVIAVTPYRLKRIVSFLDQSADTQGKNYQLDQARMAIGSGGIVGRGYGQSVTKTNYLPAVVDDSIFAVIGEELGFVGSGMLIALFGIFTFRLFWLAKRTGDRFGRFLLIGFGMVIGVQAFVNMASISGLIPLTGVPLPFVSYGGSAFAVFLTMSGIALNVSKYE